MGKTILNSVANNYGSLYKVHYFEQYKMYVESMEKVSDRRQKANNYFLTINTITFSIIGLSFETKSVDVYPLIRPAISIFGILICIIFWHLFRSYRQLNTGKFKVIHEIEHELPLSLYEYEWDILKRGHDYNKYFPFSHIELLIPIVFGLFYLALSLILLLRINL